MTCWGQKAAWNGRDGKLAKITVMQWSLRLFRSFLEDLNLIFFSHHFTPLSHRLNQFRTHKTETKLHKSIFHGPQKTKEKVLFRFLKKSQHTQKKYFQINQKLFHAENN